MPTEVVRLKVPPVVLHISLQSEARQTWARCEELFQLMFFAQLWRLASTWVPRFDGAWALCEATFQLWVVHASCGHDFYRVWIPVLLIHRKVV